MGSMSMDTECPQDLVMCVLFFGGSAVCLLIMLSEHFLGEDRKLDE